MNDKTTRQCLDLYRAVALRGFTIKEIGSLDTQDGVAWHATLCKGKTKVLTAGNDGTGGPDWIQLRLPGDSRTAREAQAKPIIDELMDIPEVCASVRAFDESVARLRLEYDVEDNQAKNTETTIEQARATVLAEVETVIQAIHATPARRDDEAIAGVVGELMDTAKVIASLKRVCKKSTAWLRKNEPLGSYMQIKRPETPEIRQHVLNKKADDFDGFVSDAIAGL